MWISKKERAELDAHMRLIEQLLTRIADDLHTLVIVRQKRKVATSKTKK